MREPVQRTVWWLLAAGLSWQAAAGTARLAQQVWQAREVGLAARLTEPTDERLRRGLGADLAIVQGLREVAQPGEWLMCRVVFTAEALDERTGIVARLTRLRHALFPWPLVSNGGAEPIAAAEAATPPGRSTLLLVLDGEPAPGERPGWLCVARGEGFQAWRLRRE